MVNGRCIRVGTMVVVILAALLLVGCSKQTASSYKPTPKPIAHGAATPLGAVRGYLAAVRDGNVKQALSYWEFPKKGTEAYKIAQSQGGKSDQTVVIAEAKKRRLDWTKRQINSKWNFDAILYVRPPVSGYTHSLTAANWALVLVSYNLPNQHSVAAEYVVHKDGGRWWLLARSGVMYGVRN